MKEDTRFVSKIKSAKNTRLKTIAIVQINTNLKILNAKSEIFINKLELRSLFFQKATQHSILM